ncbi:MAG: hypothetical protein NZ960_07185 [Candidatus Kapabacteria bacterium]|nr:hypothetical protein [Candidatus Kapabacteria bacterium]MDW8013000.1 hypothetical protein [Bacteroidota bacterium]
MVVPRLLFLWSCFSRLGLVERTLEGGHRLCLAWGELTEAACGSIARWVGQQGAGVVGIFAAHGRE